MVATRLPSDSPLDESSQAAAAGASLAAHCSKMVDIASRRPVLSKRSANANAWRGAVSAILRKGLAASDTSWSDDWFERIHSNAARGSSSAQPPMTCVTAICRSLASVAIANSIAFNGASSAINISSVGTRSNTGCCLAH